VGAASAGGGAWEPPKLASKERMRHTSYASASGIQSTNAASKVRMLKNGCGILRMLKKLEGRVFRPYEFVIRSND